MKRLRLNILSMLAALLLVAVMAVPSMAASRIYGFTALTGGTAGCLDSLPLSGGPALATGDEAFGIGSGVFYSYKFNAGSSAASNPPLVIVPSSGSGRWEIADTYLLNSNVNSVEDFRLTLTSVTPVTTADVTNATAIYCSPFKGNRMALYDGANWHIRNSAEFSLALGTLAAAFQAYDVFAYDNAGVPTLEFLEWQSHAVTITHASPGVATWNSHPLVNGNRVVLTTTGTLPTGLSPNTQYYVVAKAANTFELSLTFGGTAINTTGDGSGTHTVHNPYARATALVYQDGILSKSGDTTRRYLGTFFSTSTTATADAVATRYLENYYNTVDRQMQGTFSTNRTTTSVGTMVELNTEIRFYFVAGNTDNPMRFDFQGYTGHTVATAYTVSQIYLDGSISLTGNLSLSILSPTANLNQFGNIHDYITPAVGYHYATLFGNLSYAGTGTWFPGSNRILAVRKM
jgi:hypothetical protein